MEEKSLALEKFDGLCSVIGCLNTFEAMAMQKFLRKMAVIKRLAALLEFSGDLLTLPDISKYIPAISINFEMYDALREACPELRLPSSSTIDSAANLESLRSQITQSYAMLDAWLNDHPWNRAGWLQNKADALYEDLVAPVVEAADKVTGFLACFQSICDTVDTLASVPLSDQVKMNDALKNIQKAPGDYLNAASDSFNVKITKLRTMRSDLRRISPQLNPLDYSDKGLGL